MKPPIYIYIVDLNEYLDSPTYQVLFGSMHLILSTDLGVPISEFLLFLIHFQTIIDVKTHVKSFRISIDVPIFQMLKTYQSFR